MRKMIYQASQMSCCYFRSTVEKPNLKVLLQVTERCNLHCKHCFNSSESIGNDFSYQDIVTKVIPKLLKSNVTRVTLTGGEPMVHPQILDIVKAFIDKGIHITLCTNGTRFTKETIEYLHSLKNIHINVSLDGFSFNSHGTFRGIPTIYDFNTILKNIKLMGEKKLLNGILCAPNQLSNDDEYLEMCKFAKENQAAYVLFNPLSKFGRGNETHSLSYSTKELINLRKKIELLDLEDDNFQIVFIRIFENKISKNCMAKCNFEIPYIFVDGNVAVCPYMIFATDSNMSNYTKEKFFYGSILDKNFNLQFAIKHYKLLNKEEFHNRGCIASKITNGLKLDDFDNEIYYTKGAE